jgi:hypothetical protein
MCFLTTYGITAIEMLLPQVHLKRRRQLDRHLAVIGGDRSFVQIS